MYLNISAIFFALLLLNIACDAPDKNTTDLLDAEPQMHDSETSSSDMDFTESDMGGEEMVAGETGQVEDMYLGDMEMTSMDQGGTDEMINDMEVVSLSLSIDSPMEGMVYPNDDDIVVRGTVVVEGSSLEFVGLEATLDI